MKLRIFESEDVMDPKTQLFPAIYVVKFSISRFPISEFVMRRREADEEGDQG